MAGEQFLTYRPLPGARLNMAHPLSKGLVGCWLLNENGGIRAMDISPYGNHGKLVGFASPPPRRFNGLPFDGVDDLIDCGSAAVLADLGPLTYIAWINPISTGEGGNGRILHKRTASTSTSGTGFYLSGINAISFMIDYATTDLVHGSVSNSITMGILQSVAVTWDGGAIAANAHIYIKGVETTYAILQDGVGARVSDAANPQVIGNSINAVRTFHGLIGLAMIYNLIQLPSNIKWLDQDPYCMILR